MFVAQLARTMASMPMEISPNTILAIHASTAVPMSMDIAANGPQRGLGVSGSKRCAGEPTNLTG